MPGPLVGGFGGNIRRGFADGAYDGAPVTDAIRAACPPRSPPRIIVPPRKQSIPQPEQVHGGAERECHAIDIAAHGQMNWRQSNDYGLRSLAETGVGRVKRLNDGKLNSRTFGVQCREVAVQIAVLNRMIRAAKPNTVRTS